MLERVKNLAQFVRLGQKLEKKYVLMLGAGASLSSGVKLTKTIIDELVGRYAQGQSAESVEDRFDRLWSNATPDARMGMLQPYLSRAPSSGYRRLAKLIRLGFFDEVLTFNFDCLLEHALRDEGLTEFKTIIRGETSDEAIAALLDAVEPRVKLLKLHGSLRSSNQFLFTKEEMFQYPDAIHAAVHNLTGRDLIVCGYAFNDKCVERAFSPSKSSGAIYCVDPNGAPSNLKSFLSVRRSSDNVVSGELGKFDQFFEALYAELTGTQSVARPKRENTFKFLDHYHEEQRSWFLGRRPLTFDLVRKLGSQDVHGLWVSGRPKVGKTSLLRAALVPQLTNRGYQCIYVRCKSDLRAMLQAALAQHGFGGGQLTETLRQLNAAGKPIVLVLDQFERVCRAYKSGDESLKENILTASRTLVDSAGPSLRVVFVGIDEKALFEFFMKLRPPTSFVDVEVKPLSRKRVEVMIRYFSRRGGSLLNEHLIRELCAEYEQGMAKERPTFTLTHVQTICYYLMRGSYRSHDEYRQQPGLAAALDSIQDESNLIDMLDDLPPGQRVLLRKFLKVVCDRDSNSRTIVEFIRDHFLDGQDECFPEPLT